MDALADLFRAADSSIVAACGLSVSDVADAVLVAASRVDVLALNRSREGHEHLGARIERLGLRHYNNWMRLRRDLRDLSDLPAIASSQVDVREIDSADANAFGQLVATAFGYLRQSHRYPHRQSAVLTGPITLPPTAVRRSRLPRCTSAARLRGSGSPQQTPHIAAAARSKALSFDGSRTRRRPAAHGSASRPRRTRSPKTRRRSETSGGSDSKSRTHDRTISGAEGPIDSQGVC